jgi:hypothetical protein
VALLLNCPFPDSPLLIMEVPGRKGRATHHAVVRVVRERRGPDGNTYLAGVFEPPLSERVLEDLLAGGLRKDTDEEA